MCALVSLLSVLPYTTPMYAVEVERNVVYAHAEGYWTHAPVGEPGTVRHQAFLLRKRRPLDLDMDIYLPEGDESATRPLLLMMHGGSFFVGNKEEMGQAGWCEYFAKLGYVAVSLNYREGFLPTRKDLAAAEERALEDADAALEYLLERKDLRIDPEFIFAAGTSAGAMIALRMAFRPAGDHPRIRAVGNFWGSVHDLGVLEQGNAAILSFQSPDDPVMPYDRGYPFRTGKKRFQPPVQWFSEVMYGTEAIHKRAAELGLRTEHHACPEARHRLHIDDDGQYTERFFEIRDRMREFFAEEISARPSAPDRR
jgi:poly(3-hydroxybutyrate) depolymerase